jgi:hypothetical protein
MSLLESKSLLAKLMATEDLIVEQRPVDTAYFDVKNRILTIPILDKNLSPFLYDLFMGHEVGHALYTPLEGLHKIKELKLSPSVANVVEDSRIERKIKYKYPGLKNSFVKAYKDLFDRDFFGLSGEDVNTLNFIDRVNLHCKVGALLNVNFNDEERALLNDIENSETYDDVIVLTKRITEFMKNQMEEERQTITVNVPDEGDTEQTDGQKKSEESTEEESELEEDAQPKDQPSNQGSDESEQEQEEEKTESGDGESQQKDIEKQAEQTDEIRSHTDDSFYENQRQLFDKNPAEYAYVNVPEVSANQAFDHKDLWKKYKDDGFNVDQGTKAFIALRSETNKVVSYLVKEFEMRKNADQMKRATTAKTGDLDMKKIFSYKFNEDIFKKISVVPGGKSHGLVMFVDWSGSMVDHLSNTMKQLFNLVMFCKKVNIPYEVYAFAEDTVTDKMVNASYKRNDLVLSRYGLLNLLSSRMTALEFTYAASALCRISGIAHPDGRVDYHAIPYWMSLSGTPLNEAILHAMTIVPEFQKKNKLQIVNTIFLTDGEGRTMREYASPSNYGELRRTNIRANIVYVRDPKTKHQECYGTIGNKYIDQTTALLKLLRLRTHSNVVGFYVINGRDFNRKATGWFPKAKSHDAIREEFRKSNFAVVEESGYNEYYILRSNGLDTDDDAVFEVKEGATSRGLVSAFTKFNSGRHNSRVVLNRFIKLIA